MGKIFDIATNPHQFDKNVYWQNDGDISPISENFLEYLIPYTKNWKSKDLLDIGAGTGWLLPFAKELGVSSAIGLEPSEKIYNLSQKYHPDSNIIKVNLENYRTQNKFDVITAIMVFGHIADLNVAFLKMSQLIKPSGKLFLVIPDFEHFKKPRFDYEITFEDLNSDEYAVLNKSEGGETADVVRSVAKFKKVAAEHNFKLLEDIPMPPTTKLIEKIPKYKESKNEPLTRLLRFKFLKMTPTETRQ